MDKIQQIKCSFTSEADLYQAYMVFIKGGGLFIRTHHIYQMGTPIHLTIKLIDEDNPYEVEAKVVWVTPKGSQGNRVPGIGVQFLGENSRYICNKIETYLAGMLKSSQITDTM